MLFEGNHMESIVIYDIVNEGYTEWNILIKIICFIIIIIFVQQLIFYYLEGKKFRFKYIKWSLLLFFYFIFSIMVVLTSYPQYMIAKSARLNNKYKIVTGKVRNIEVTYGKIPSQKFYVGDVLFWVEDGGYHSGYNKTIQKGAPFYTGKCVRIWYAKVGNENAILRLEVLKDNRCDK